MIFDLASPSATEYYRFALDYGPSKTGVRAQSKALSVELTPSEIKANAASRASMRSTIEKELGVETIPIMEADQEDQIESSPKLFREQAEAGRRITPLPANP